MENAQKKGPKWEEFTSEYANEMEIIAKELKEDQALQPALQIIFQVAQQINAAVAGVAEVGAQAAQQLRAALVEIWEKAAQAANEHFWPIIQVWLEKLQNLALSIHENALSNAGQMLKIVADALNQMNTLSAPLAEIMTHARTFYASFAQNLQGLGDELGKMWEEAQEVAKNVPGWKEMQDYLVEIGQKFSVKEQVSMVIKELMSTLQQSVKWTKQWEDFVGELADYVNKVSAKFIFKRAHENIKRELFLLIFESKIILRSSQI